MLYTAATVSIAATVRAGKKNIPSGPFCRHRLYSFADFVRIFWSQFIRRHLRRVHSRCYRIYPDRESLESYFGRKKPCQMRCRRFRTIVSKLQDRSTIHWGMTRIGLTCSCATLINPLMLVMLMTDDVQPGVSSEPFSNKPRKATVMKNIEKVLIR